MEAAWDIIDIMMIHISPVKSQNNSAKCAESVKVWATFRTKNGQNQRTKSGSGIAIEADPVWQENCTAFAGFV